MTNGRPICYTLCSDQALETYLCSHLEDVEVAVIRIVVCKGSDVVEHQLCVGAEITVQADGDVVPEYPAHKKKPGEVRARQLKGDHSDSRRVSEIRFP